MIDYFDCHPLDGYRRLTFMMLDEDVVALSPSTTYRVLSKAGRPRWNEAVEEGNGLRSAAATAPTLAYGYLVLESGRDVLLPVLVSGWCESGGGSLGDSRIDDGSRVHFGASKGTVPRRAGSNHLGQRSSVHREGLQDVHPHLRDDAREDRAVLPAIESNVGWTIKSDALRPANRSSLEEARRLMERFVEYYNGVRLHSAIGYIAPLDFMAGKAPEIWIGAGLLEQAREARRERRSNKVPA